MNWKKLLHNRWFHSGLCILLVLAILTGLLIPGTMLQTAHPNDPLHNSEIQDIENLLLGEGEQKQDEDIDPDKTPDSTQPEETEPEETEPEQTEPEETQPEQTEPEETEPEETDPEETQPEQTEPEETEPEETTPDETEPDETNPEETVPGESQPEDPGDGDGDEGQEDGNEGEEGGEESELDLAMVMTWYKYGTQPKTILCGPSDAVSKSINTAQLVNDELKYAFSLTGEEADNVTISSVSMKVGDGAFTETSENGAVIVSLPEGGAQRDYTFQVSAVLKKRDAQGEMVEQEIQFTYVLHCAYALDLELELSWKKNQDTTGMVTCAANKTAVKTVESNELTENVFAYTPKLIGTLADNAQIVGAEYTTASGLGGKLQAEGGSLVFQTAGGTEEETYFLTFEVQLTDEEGGNQTVFYHITIVFVETLDIDLSFTWLERGVTRKALICQPDGQVSQDIKNNQLSAGAVKYEIELTGADSESARILNISYTSEGSGGGKLDASGALPLTLPTGFTSNTYTILVVVLANGKQLNFEVMLHYTMDVSLEMTYTVIENGVPTDRSVICENGKSKTAEAIYDDQLSDGLLSYEMSIGGTDAMEITSVTCYQSGSGRTVTLGSTDDLQLLLKNGKTGENAFLITAEDTEGTQYEFKINIPYKHRGENTVKITTNMTDGQVVTNEANTNLSVNAWSEDGAGNVISNIPANGVDTKLIVMLDGEELGYVSSSGPASEYILYPSNPEVGDTNEHTLYIYAEDAYGNYGELTLTLKGQRNQAGQKKGTATIYVDLSVVGLGVVGSVSYDVLADEPISYSIAKAVLGMDTGDPFGAAENALAWKGRYSGTLDTGFYLQSLTPGLTANALEGSSWNQYGSNEQEILQAMDNYFGKGTGLATLWRCIYRNGLNKSSGSNGSYGEFDYTSGSGWMFSLDGTYYPGLSMSEYSLEDGDVLTLRYTLAYGWDAGGGTAGYGNTTGYCVTAMNGSYYINHQMETIENADGSLSYVCRCCGLVEACAHENASSIDLGDGTHITYCEDCKTTIGDPEEHIWESMDEVHSCTACGATEAHTWKEVTGSNTATCTQAGTRTVYCVFCEMVKEEESPAKGHTLNNRWNHTKTEHYQKCSTCQEVIAESRGEHQYEYDTGDDDWYCKVCDAGHDWDYCGNDGLTVYSATCKTITYYCADCGLYFTKEGTFPEYHDYVDGRCSHCGETDPNYTPPETDPPVTEPPVTDPPETDPPETTTPETGPPATESPTDPPEPPETTSPETDIPSQETPE